MTSDPGLTRRVERLENDTESIYELLAELKVGQAEHTARFDGIDGRLDRMDERFDGIDGRLDRMDERFDGIGGRLDRMDERFDGIDGRLAGIDTTLAEILRRLPAS